MKDWSSPTSAHAEDALAQSLRDAMVESLPNFSSVDAEDQRNLHASMGSPQAPYTEPLFNLTNDTSTGYARV